MLCSAGSFPINLVTKVRLAGFLLKNASRGGGRWESQRASGVRLRFDVDDERAV